MRILFVSSGNSKHNISPFIYSQGESISKYVEKLDFYPLKGRGILNYLKHISRLKKHLASFKYDIIHAHYGLSGIVSYFAKSNEKLIVSFMGDDLIGSVNSSGKYSFYGKILVTINKIFLKKYDFVITKSQQLSSKIKRTNCVVTVPNGVNINYFNHIEKSNAKKHLKINYNSKLIIFISNPERKEKNIELANASVMKVNNPDIIFRKVFNVEQSELLYYYSAAECLLLTSVHEGSPNVIKEAMACGCPIVSTDVGDVKWVFDNTEGCFLTSFEPDDVSAKIKMALEFSEKYGRTRGRERIIELGLDSDTIAKKIVEIYKKVTR